MKKRKYNKKVNKLKGGQIMDRENTVKEIVRRYNEKEGTILDLVKEYEGYSRNKFYRDIAKLGIVKDDEKDIYILKNDNIEGQLNILDDEAPGEEIKKDSPGELEERKATKMIKVKKTYEIEEFTEKAVKIQATLEGKTINDYVNDVLQASISDEVKKLIE